MDKNVCACVFVLISTVKEWRLCIGTSSGNYKYPALCPYLYVYDWSWRLRGKRLQYHYTYFSLLQYINGLKKELFQDKEKNYAQQNPLTW